MARKRKLVRRRRLRIDKLIVGIVLLVMIVGTFGWSVMKLYELTMAAHRKYQDFQDSLQTKHTLTGRLADPRFDGYTNVLLLGLDSGNTEEADSARNADAIIIASIKKADGSVRLLSVPGETLVSIPGRQNVDNVNKAYFYGEMQLMVRTLEESLYFPLHHYLVIDMNAFKSFVDLSGGVDLYVEDNMEYKDAYSGFEISLPKGYQHLDGAAAEQYVRYRSDELGSIGRVQRQQRFVRALNEQLSQEDMVAKLPQLITLIREQTVSSLAPLDAVEIVQALYNVQADKISIEMLPGEFVMINGRQHWQTTEEDKQLLLDKYFPAADMKQEETQEETK